MDFLPFDSCRALPSVDIISITSSRWWTFGLSPVFTMTDSAALSSLVFASCHIFVTVALKQISINEIARSRGKCSCDFVSYCLICVRVLIPVCPQNHFLPEFFVCCSLYRKAVHIRDLMWERVMLSGCVALSSKREPSSYLWCLYLGCPGDTSPQIQSPE